MRPLVRIAKEAAVAKFLGLGRRNKHERAGFQHYNTAVAAARDPYLFEALGVPNTLDGRFDMIALHAFLVIQRVKREGEAGAVLAQAVFDAMFSDMDINLRELGVSDLSVGKRVRAMWEAFHGRANAYAAALEAGDPDALQTALARNAWRGQPPPAGSAAALRRMVLAQTAELDSQSMAELAAGTVRFLPAEEASR